MTTITAKPPTGRRRPEIAGVKIIIEPDDFNDSSWLGEFTDHPNRTKYDQKKGEIVDRFEGDDNRRSRGYSRSYNNGREPRYWECNGYDDKFKFLVSKGYSKGEADRISRAELHADYMRLEALYNGDWCLVTVMVEVEIRVPLANGTTYAIHHVRDCVGGVESDAVESYFRELASDCASQVMEELETLGVKKRAIKTAFRDFENIEIEYK